MDIAKDAYDAAMRLEESLDGDMVAVPLENILRGAVVGFPGLFIAMAGRWAHLC
jgi:hypothetical protein